MRSLILIAAMFLGSSAEITEHFDTIIEKPGTAADACIGVEELAADSESGYDVKFSVISQDPDGGFVVDNSGTLMCDPGMVNSYGPKYQITIRMSTQEPDEEETITIDVTFPDVPSNIKFTDPVDHTSITINEDIGPDENIKTLVATSPADQVTFTIENDESGLFQIQGNNLKTSSSVTSSTFDVDKEGAQQTYQLTLKASDGTTSDTVMVHIEVMGIDDNEPAFEKAEYVFNMFENATDGDVIGQVKASDADEPNTIFKYTIGGIDTDRFLVNADSGYIMVKGNRKFNSSETDEFSFKVVATDGTARTTEATVTVTLRSGRECENYCDGNLECYFDEDLNPQCREPGKASSTMIIIIAAAAGGAVVLIALIVIVVCCIKRRKRTGKKTVQERNDGEEMKPLQKV